MKIALFYKGSSRQGRINLPAWSWFTFMGISALSLCYTAYDLIDQQQQYTALNQELETLKQQSGEQLNELSTLQQRTSDELTAYKSKIVELQTQLNRIHLLGERLAKAANIPETELALTIQSSSNGPSAQGGVFEAAPHVQVDESKLLSDIEQLAISVEQQTYKMSLLESLYFNHHIDQNATVSGRPVSAGWLSSYFGTRKDPFTGEAAMHRGVDFAGKAGDPVLSTGAGIVIWAGDKFGYGQLIEIDHGKGYVSRYGHNQNLLVKVGDVVQKGQQIAEMGSTGRSTGIHVHYEVLRDGQQVDPLKFVYRK